jgi:glycosyltransferase involved in cell wall biosynthesis
MKSNPRLIRITTVPMSLKYLLSGQLTFFQQNGFEILAVSADGPEVIDLAREVNHRVIPMTRKMTPFQDLYCLWLLIRTMQKFKPDVVHSHTPKAGLLGMLAAWLCRVPVRMHTVAGLPLMEARGVTRKILELTERVTYACATRVYPNSFALMRYMNSRFKIQDSKFNLELRLKNKFNVIGKGSSNGIDISLFNRSEMLEQQAKLIREKYAIAESEVVFSFVGRLVKDKGLVELVNAFQQLAIPARLLLIGGFEEHLDPLPKEVMTFLKRSPRVILAGFQHDVRHWMMSSDVFVFPSYREGFPNVVMQAACLEVASIVSDINGCNELIVHGKTGLIVPTKDAEKLLAAMQEMVSNKERAKRMAKASREFVIANFDRAYVWNELLKEYKDLMMSGRL